MASSNQKIPIPLPVSGVMKDQNPRTIGPTALVDAKNWVYRDGVFSVRPGVQPLDPGSVNLIPKDWLASLDMSTFPFFTPRLDALNFQDSLPQTGFVRSSVSNEYWYPFGETIEEYLASDQWFRVGVWQAGDPAFLNHSPGGHYLEINHFDHGLGHYLTIVSPPITARAVPYTASFKIAQNFVAPSNAKVYARLCGFRWTNPSNEPPLRIVGVDESGHKYEAFPYTLSVSDFDGFTDVTHDWTEPDRVYLTFDNTVADADWVALVFSFYDDNEAATYGLGDVMIYEGTEEVPYQLPSGYWSMGERPLGVCQFDQSSTSPITVVGTTHGLWEVNNDFTLSQIADARWSSGEEPPPGSGVPAVAPVTSPDRLVSFRVFDGTAGRLLLATNGESDVLQWDGSGSAEVAGGPAGGLSAKCMAVCFNRMIYGNVGGVMPGVTAEDGVMVTYPLYHVDDSPLHPAWIARLADTPGPIVAMLEMGNMQTAIYKTDCIYMAIGQGMDPSFRFELRCTCAGPASPLSVVALSDGVHAYLSNTGDVIIFDGVRPHSLGQHVQAYIQESIDFDRLGQSFAFFNEERKELYIFYPPYGGGDVFRCVMISMASDGSSLWPLGWRDALTAVGSTVINLAKTIDQLEGEIDDLPGCIDDFTSLRPAFLLMDSSGGPLVFESNEDWLGAIDSYFQTGLYDLGAQTSFKTLQEIDHIFSTDSGQDVTIDVLISNYGKEQISDGPKTVSLGSPGPRVTRHRATGRMFSLRVSGSTTGVLEWLGSEASVVVRGMR